MYTRRVEETAVEPKYNNICGDKYINCFINVLYSRELTKRISSENNVPQYHINDT